MPEQIIPGATTVAVTSGKGGVGKSTTAVALASALTDRGHNVLVIDADVDGPNVHLLADVTDRDFGVDAARLTLRLPSSPLGFRVVSPVSLLAADERARVSVADLVAAAQFADPADIVIVDLPPGFTTHHEHVCAYLPEVVLAVVAPTPSALSDHARHVQAWKAHWLSVVKNRQHRDKRRKVVLPEQPHLAAVETMARFTGIPDGADAPVTIRRIDAVAVDAVATRAAPVVSLPSTATIKEAAATAEIGVIVDLVLRAHLGLEPAAD